jgi:hypothetical protein
MQLEHLEESDPKGYAQLDKEVIKQSDEEFERVRARFEYVLSDGSKSLRRRWCALSLADRAAKANALGTYRLIYPITSQMAHGTIGGLASHFELDKDPHRMFSRPSPKWLATALVSAHKCMLTALDSLCNVLSVEPNPSRDQLAGDYHYAWIEPEKYYGRSSS